MANAVPSRGDVGGDEQLIAGAVLAVLGDAGGELHAGQLVPAVRERLGPALAVPRARFADLLSRVHGVERLVRDSNPSAIYFRRADVFDVPLYRTSAVRGVCAHTVRAAPALDAPAVGTLEWAQRSVAQLHVAEAAAFDSAFTSASSSEERFSVDDTDAAFLAYQARSLEAHVAQEEATGTMRWVRVRGRSAIDGVVRIGSSSGETDYEYTRRIRLGPRDGVFLGRWHPLNAERPRPRLVPLSGFVAIKLLAPLEVDEPVREIAELELHRRLQAAAHVGGRRAFVNLVDAFADERDGQLLVFLIEELCVGTLGNRLHLSPEFPLNERERFASAWAVARATAFLHAQVPPVVHRDIRLSNCLIDERGAVMLSDFGMSRAAVRMQAPPRDSAAFAPTSTLVFRADASRMASAAVELGASTLRRRHDITHQPREVYEDGITAFATSSDVWLLGQLLFMIFARNAERPFVDPTIEATTTEDRDVRAHLNHQENVGARRDPHWQYLRPDTPPAMAALMQWMLLHEAALRPSMDVVLASPAFWSCSAFSERTLCLRSALMAPAQPLHRLCAFIDSSEYERVGHHLVPTLQRDDVSGALVVRAVPVAELSRDAQQNLARLAADVAGEASRRGLRGKGLLEHFCFSDPAMRTPAIRLIVWMRNYLSHIHDEQDDGPARDAHLRFVVTRHPYGLGAWSDPGELLLRHPAVGWLWPTLFRVLVANRDALGVQHEALADILPRSLLPSVPRAPRPPLLASAVASVSESAEPYAHTEASGAPP